MLSDEELNELAIKVSTILEGNSISRIIPSDVAQWLRDSTFNRGMTYQFVMPLAGSSALMINLKVTLAGEIEITLNDQTNSPFWTGTLKELK